MTTPPPAGQPTFPSAESRPILDALRDKLDRLALPGIGHAAYEDYVLHKYKLASLQGLTREIGNAEWAILSDALKDNDTRDELLHQIKAAQEKIKESGQIWKIN